MSVALAAAVDLGVDLPPFSSPAVLAEKLDVPLATVYAWNAEGTGPRPIRAGKHVRYARAEVVRWLESRMLGAATLTTTADSTRPDLGAADAPRGRRTP